MKILPLALSILIIFSGSAKAQTASSSGVASPLPSAELLGFIENNPKIFDAAYKKKLFEGYKEVIYMTSDKSIKPFVFDGQWVNIPNTASPVRTDNPGCVSDNPAVDNTPKRDDDVRKLMAGLAITSAVTADSVPVVAVVAIVASIGVSLFTKDRQNFGACALTCTLVPGEIDSATISQLGKVTLTHSTPSNQHYSGSIDVNDPSGVISNLGWAGWETPLFSVTSVPKNQSPIKLPPQHPAASKAEGGVCPATLVCGRFKNWSDSWPRDAKISLALSAGPWLEKGCYDTSIIDTKTRQSLLQPALKRKDISLSDLLDKYNKSLPR